MQNQEIPSDKWVRFFNAFSKRHQGDHVTIELIGREVGDQYLAQDQSLLGITVDPPTGACKIQVTVGDPKPVNISHEIAHPIHVRLAKAEDGRDAALEIESDGGPSTLLRFLPVEQMPPSMGQSV